MTQDREQEQAEALWYVAPGRVEVRPVPVPVPGPGDVTVRAVSGAISRGTERLVYTGRVPRGEYTRMRVPHMSGAFPFPLKYGYTLVGVVETGPEDLVGRTVFLLHPHQTRCVVPASDVIPVPDTILPRRAVLAAIMETALNAMWDAAPGPADEIAVVGGGVVGLLVAFLCSSLRGAKVTVVDIAARRAEVAHRLGLAFALPKDAPENCDVVFHASQSGDGLSTALRLAGDEATVVELSWYGSGDVAVPLGGAFHSRRLKLMSSQVGRVSPSHRPRWTPKRRLAAALSLLTDERLDVLLAPAVRLHDLPGRLAHVFAPESDVLCQVIDYR